MTFVRSNCALVRIRICFRAALLMESLRLRIPVTSGIWNGFSWHVMFLGQNCFWCRTPNRRTGRSDEGTQRVLYWNVLIYYDNLLCSWPSHCFFDAFLAGCRRIPDVGNHWICWRRATTPNFAFQIAQPTAWRTAFGDSMSTIIMLRFAHFVSNC